MPIYIHTELRSNMHLDDDQLIALISKCALRDESALKKLYEYCSGFLNSVAYRIVHSDEISNEVLQEAFLQIWQNAGSYRVHLARPMTWMTSIVRYRALDRIRSESRHARRPLTPEEEQSEIDNSADPRTPFVELESYRTGMFIQMCLSEFSEKVKKSVELAYIYGYSREELASTLDAKVNTVKSWLRRGSERLKQCLKTKIDI